MLNNKSIPKATMNYNSPTINDLLRETRTSINFPNYQNFNDTTEVYDDFIQKIMVAIFKVTPIKERTINHISQEWFDGDTFEVIKKLLKKFKRSRFHINK